MTEELNHALLLRLASEFQGFCRDLHDEAVESVVGVVAAKNVRLQQVLTMPFTAGRQLDRGNAQPGSLGSDFGWLGIDLWDELRTRYPAKAKQWQGWLSCLNDARNGIAHDDPDKLSKLRAKGWSVTLANIRRWRSGLDGLAHGMDYVTGDHLHRLLEVVPW